MQETTVTIDNGSISKKAIISEDPKRPGLLIGRCFDKNDKFVGTFWGKKWQADLQAILTNPKHVFTAC